MIEKTKTLSDCEQALDVSINAFYPEGATEKIIQLWRYKWFEDPSFSNENILIVKDAGQIVAGIRMVRRSLRRGSQIYRMLGIGEIFVLPGYQGRGLTSELIYGIIKQGHDEKADLLVGIARKAIDGFYTRYGLWGMGSYSELSFRGIAGNTNVFSFEVPQDLDFKIFAQAYDVCYRDTFGAMCRNDKHWQFIYGLVNRTEQRFLSIKCAMGTIGYVICNQTSVIELAVLPEVNYNDVLSSLKALIFFDSESLVLKLPPQHPVLEKDLGVDVTTRLRECSYGGHIVKILNKETVVQYFLERENSWYRLNGIHNYQYERAGLRVSMSSGGLNISEAPGHNSKTETDDCSYEKSILLLGAQPQYKVHSSPSLSAPRLPFFIPTIDEF